MGNKFSKSVLSTDETIMNKIIPFHSQLFDYYDSGDLKGINEKRFPIKEYIPSLKRRIRDEVVPLMKARQKTEDEKILIKKVEKIAQ